MNRDLSGIRKDFNKETLSENNLNEHPVIQFKSWLSEAIESNQPEPTAMTLSTVSPQGKPSGRIVLLKKVSIEEGFWFFTNYSSKKGKHIEQNNYGSLNFFWPALERQIRIEGKIEKISDEESDAYFKSRPTDSQISAIISPQSEVIESRDILESWYKDIKSNQNEFTRPKNWGGYTIIPTEIEFWQGRSGRLHDRIRYRLEGNIWIKERLAP